ncbi:MAG: hypothetical protein QM733_18960 [Ilumatobacteraceae bacterium]
MFNAATRTALALGGLVDVAHHGDLLVRARFNVVTIVRGAGNTWHAQIEPDALNGRRSRLFHGRRHTAELGHPIAADVLGRTRWCTGVELQQTGDGWALVDLGAGHADDALAA